MRVQRPEFDTEALRQFQTTASHCRTPKQFRGLLDRLHTHIPYTSLACGWGYRSHAMVGYIFNHGYPLEFLRWYLTKGMLWKGPVFAEWLRTNKPLVTVDIVRRLHDEFDPELLDKIRKFNLQYSLGGGLIRKDLWIFFSVNMESEENCRLHLKRFQTVVPLLAKALKRACPRPLLTNREKTILERRTMGEVIKQIAAEEGIAARTVTMHLQHIKKKLYTDDLVNAVVIAVQSGMIDHTWKQWRWGP